MTIENSTFMPNTTASSRKTKIVATIGPASSDEKTIRELILAGLNVARLNFSHGTHEEHTKAINTIRRVANELNRPIAVFQDLCGPKVRITAFENDGVDLESGKTISLSHTSESATGTSEDLYIKAFDPAKVMKAGERALLADGRIVLKAKEVKKGKVLCEIIAGGRLRSRSGIAVPESKLELDPLTPKDLKDLKWAVENSADYVALSFVQSEHDVQKLRGHLEKLGSDIPIIAKIERAGSLDRINDIAESANALMVARGDLGLELPLERVPNAQALVIDTANFRGTPVITATQMLQSMVTEIRPTRAEVSDVATAVKDGTDAVMLSEETAIGKYPVQAVEVLDKIIRETERHIFLTEDAPSFKSSDRNIVPDAICYAACGAADKIAAQAIIAGTQSGNTARLLSKYRPRQPLFGVTSVAKVVNRMALYWGVEPVMVTLKEHTSEEEVAKMLQVVRDEYGYKQGSRVVITAGRRAKESGATSMMEVREIPRAT